MAEVLVRFTKAIYSVDGDAYQAQASGATDADGLWEGWIEFIRRDGTAFRTPRETEQPNREALTYWSEGLSAAYLEGALRRALDSLVVPVARVSSAEPSIFDRPAAAKRTGRVPHHAHPVLDPFATYEQGDGVLRQQLSALSRDHLLTLVDAYSLPVEVKASDANRTVVEDIVRAVARYHTSSHSDIRIL